MKGEKMKKIISIVLSLLILAAGFVHAQEAQTAASQTHWGFGVGGVANRIPLALSTFNVLMSQIWYSYTLGDPNAESRFATSVGAYGFLLIMPVPKVSIEYYLGKEDQGIQFKTALSGFYDIVVGGHAGLAAEVGMVIVNKFDISLFVVPAGTDSVTSYGQFIGLRTRDQARDDFVKNREAGTFLCDYERRENDKVVPEVGKGCNVRFPYFGFLVGMRF
jgi:hypothetical protein